jgi:hypothetical protein
MNLLICFNMSFRGIDFILPRLAFSRTNVTKTQVTFQVVSRARPCDVLERRNLLIILSNYDWFFESVEWFILRKVSRLTHASPEQVF